MNARWGVAVSGAVAAVAVTVAAVTLVGDDRGSAESQAAGPVLAGSPSSMPPGPTPPASGAGTITVNGHGVVSAAPDTVSVTLGVSVRDAQATVALDRASERAATLLDTLRGLGVAGDDVTTTGVSLWPQYDHSAQRPDIVGYEASNHVSATIRDVGSAGRVIDAAAGAVGDAIRIEGISFSVDDSDAVLGEARAAAMADAATKARQYAAAGGVGVGTVVQISETHATTPWHPMPTGQMDAAGASRAAVPLEAGTRDVAVDVTVVYQLTA